MSLCARTLRVAISVLLALSLSSCAGMTRRQKLTRALIVTGAVVAVAGGAVLSGCAPDNRPGPCSATGDSSSITVGLPIMAVGVAIITTALLVRPPYARPLGPPVVRHALPITNDPFGPPPNNGY